ncbi:MAG: NUDIX hydrolase [Candidatus Paceibacterota bacterium]
MSKNIIQKIVVAAVILYKNRILLLQRSLDEDIFPGLWELPSGKRENLESSIQALKREVREEAGLNIEVIAPINIFEYIIEKNNIIKDTTQINFLVKVKGQCKVKISKEHQNFAWVLKKDFLKYKISREIKKTILKI